MYRNKLLLLGLFVCMAIQSVGAQELEISDFRKLDRDLYARTHERLDFNDNPCAVLRVSVANAKDYTFEGNIVGSIVYEPGEAIVYMTQRSKGITIHCNHSGTHKIVFAEQDPEVPYLEKSTTYRLELKLVLPEDQQRRTLVMGSVGYHPAQLSYGAMIGVAAKHGAYMHIRTDFGSATTGLQCDDTGVLLSSGKMPYYKEGVSHTARFSFTGGYLCRFARFLYGYIGAGYGYRTLAWETVDSELVENVDHSASGVAAEVGLIGNFNRFTLSVGCQALDFKYPELNVGIGYFF